VFIGHFALGFAAKRVTPRISLAVLFAAAQFADLLWPFLLAFGIEEVRIEPGITAFTPLDFLSYPISHSLTMLLVWGFVFGILYTLWSAETFSLPVVWALVVSHWILDFVTHRPDLPLYPGGLKVGLGLWNSIPATMTVELVMYGVGLFIYARSTRPKDKIGHWAFVSLAVFLVVAYFANLSGPPPSVQAIYLVGIIGGSVLLLWSGWVDKHREDRRAHETTG
jgi:hypothetical protein